MMKNKNNIIEYFEKKLSDSELILSEVTKKMQLLEEVNIFIIYHNCLSDYELFNKYSESFKEDETLYRLCLKIRNINQNITELIYDYVHPPFEDLTKEELNNKRERLKKLYNI